MEKLAFCTMESTLLNIPERARGLKNNYRPLNVLSVLPKLFERLLSKQFAEFFETILLKCQSGFVLEKTLVCNIVYK